MAVSLSTAISLPELQITLLCRGISLSVSYQYLHSLDLNDTSTAATHASAFIGGFIYSHFYFFNAFFLSCSPPTLEALSYGDYSWFEFDRNAYLPKPVVTEIDVCVCVTRFTVNNK